MKSLIPAILCVVSGLYLVLNRNEWMTNYKGQKEPHPLGFALIILGFFIAIMAIMEAS
jgi:hypothetical protein